MPLLLLSALVRAELQIGPTHSKSTLLHQQENSGLKEVPWLVTAVIFQNSENEWNPCVSLKLDVSHVPKIRKKSCWVPQDCPQILTAPSVEGQQQKDWIQVNQATLMCPWPPLCSININLSALSRGEQREYWEARMSAKSPWTGFKSREGTVSGRLFRG